ncbi:uncharacterized protein KGF55_003731 [Candida pseudojiufengensis]|uniref:uncharacterized protein n=1 Tax=Candida pseudojiufengensis TaxID=497109 RepID=UPI00222516AE|nr:uncharacterized protein KGF55_003731 [Candida pseudojiufengensis]KAI5962655.1 hypothetical protein KGF55_003731 [Candida pseudojiufengensis]
MKFIFYLLVNLALAIAYIPDINIDQHQQQQQQQQQLNTKPTSEIIDELSLNNLLQINYKSDISTYQLSNGIKFDSGRLLFSKLDSMWSNLNLPTSNEFTIEIVFRSTGKSQDIRFSDNNLAIWIYDDSISTIGSKNFDGFKFLINNNQQQGLKIFNNDGSDAEKFNLDESLGDCQFRYLESDVPFTLRISYSNLKNWFKIQVDNNLCFKTNHVKIPVGNYKLGLTSFINSQSNEEFEILGLKVWDKVIEDAIDDHGIMIDGELKVDTITKVVDTPKDDHVRPNVVRESLMERARKHREEMLMMEQQMNQNNEIKNQPDLSIVLDRLNDLEFSIADLSKIVGSNGISSSSSSSNSPSSQEISELKELIQQSQSVVNNLQNIIAKQYIELLDSVSQLNQKLIGEVREQHFGMEEISKKVDLLMNEHKEVKYQYQKQKIEEESLNSNDKPRISNNDGVIFDKIIKWILIPLIIVLLALVVFVYRLRHDIKHSKLL